MSVNGVRQLYRELQKKQTHVVQSSEIATACICQNLFKLSYPYGVIRGERDYLVANTVHDILSQAIHGPIVEEWNYQTKEYVHVTEKIVKKSANIIEEVSKESKEIAKKEARIISPKFDEDINQRFQGIVYGITKILMKKYEQPKRVLTEVTITNVPFHHEGRIDAILEFATGFGILDWKTYDINKARGNGHERWQLISNMLLSNYRYTGTEDNWSKLLFASIVYHGGAYRPRLPIAEKDITKVKNNRYFAYQVLCGKYVRAEKPKFCPVCDTNAQGCSDCSFYREDSRMAFAGELPDNYRRITGGLFGSRYKVLEERAETHRHKHVVNQIIENIGEDSAIKELERYGILQCGYKFVSNDGITALFRKDDDMTFLEPKKVLRIIGKEQNIPLLSCVSEQGTVMEVNDTELVVSFRSKVTVDRAKLQLFNLPLIFMRDEINLTRRMLEPLHKFHRLAADYLIPKNCCDDDLR